MNLTVIMSSSRRAPAERPSVLISGRTTPLFFNSAPTVEQIMGPRPARVKDPPRPEEHMPSGRVTPMEFNHTPITESPRRSSSASRTGRMTPLAFGEDFNNVRVKDSPTRSHSGSRTRQMMPLTSGDASKHVHVNRIHSGRVTPMEFNQTANESPRRSSSASRTGRMTPLAFGDVPLRDQDRRSSSGSYTGNVIPDVLMRDDARRSRATSRAVRGSLQDLPKADKRTLSPSGRITPLSFHHKNPRREIRALSPGRMRAFVGDESRGPGPLKALPLSHTPRPAVERHRSMSPTGRVTPVSFHKVHAIEVARPMSPTGRCTPVTFTKTQFIENRSLSPSTVTEDKRPLSPFHISRHTQRGRPSQRRVSHDNDTVSADAVMARSPPVEKCNVKMTKAFALVNVKRTPEDEGRPQMWSSTGRTTPLAFQQPHTMPDGRGVVDPAVCSQQEGPLIANNKTLSSNGRITPIRHRNNASLGEMQSRTFYKVPEHQRPMSPPEVVPEGGKSRTSSIRIMMDQGRPVSPVVRDVEGHPDRPLSPFIRDGTPDPGGPNYPFVKESDDRPFSPNLHQINRPMSPRSMESKNVRSSQTLETRRSMSPIVMEEPMRPMSSHLMQARRPMSPHLMQAGRPMSPREMETRPFSPQIVETTRPLSPLMLDISRPLSPQINTSSRPMSPRILEITELLSPQLNESTRPMSPQNKRPGSPQITDPRRPMSPNPRPPVSPALGESIRPLSPVIGKSIRPLSPAIGESIRPLSPAIGESIRPLSPAIGESIRPLSPAIGESIRPLSPAIGESIRPLSPAIGESIRPLSPAIGESIRPLSPVTRAHTRPLSPMPPTFKRPMSPIDRITSITSEIDPSPRPTSPPVTQRKAASDEPLSPLSDPDQSPHRYPSPPPLPPREGRTDKSSLTTTRRDASSSTMDTHDTADCPEPYPHIEKIVQSPSGTVTLSFNNMPILDENANIAGDSLLSPDEIRSSKFWGFYQEIQDDMGRRRYISRADAVDEEGHPLQPPRPDIYSGLDKKRGSLERSKSYNYPGAVAAERPSGKVSSGIGRAHTFTIPSSSPPSLRSISHSPLRNTAHYGSERSHSSSQVAARLANQSPSPTRQLRHDIKPSSSVKPATSETAAPPDRALLHVGYRGAEPAATLPEPRAEAMFGPQDHSPGSRAGIYQSSQSEADHITSLTRKGNFGSQEKLSDSNLSGHQLRPQMQRANTYSAPGSQDLDQWNPPAHKSSSLTRINESSPTPEQGIAHGESTSQKELHELYKQKPATVTKGDNHLGLTRGERISQFKEQKRKMLGELFGGQKNQSFDSGQPEKSRKDSKEGKKKHKKSKEEKHSALADLATATLPFFAAAPSSIQTPTTAAQPGRALVSSLHQRGIFSPPPMMSREIGVFSPPPRIQHEIGVFSPPQIASPTRGPSPNITRSSTTPASNTEPIMRPTVVRSKTQPEEVPYPFALPQKTSAPVPSASGQLISGHSSRSPFVAPQTVASASSASGSGARIPAVDVQTTACITSPLSSSMTSISGRRGSTESDDFRRTASLDRSERLRRQQFAPAEGIPEGADEAVQFNSLPRPSRSAQHGSDRGRVVAPLVPNTQSNTEPVIHKPAPEMTPPTLSPVQRKTPSMSTTGTQTFLERRLAASSSLESRSTTDKAVQSLRSASLESRSPPSLHRANNIRDISRSATDVIHSTDQNLLVYPFNTQEDRRKVILGPKSKSFDQPILPHPQSDDIRKLNQLSIPHAPDHEREATPPFPLKLHTEVRSATSSQGPKLEPMIKPAEVNVTATSKHISDKQDSVHKLSKTQQLRQQSLGNDVPQHGKNIPSQNKTSEKSQRRSPPTLFKGSGAGVQTPVAHIAPSQKHSSQQKSSKHQRQKLARMDSFNRPDSPVREPLPLPKDSVISRNRNPDNLASSSDSTPPSSPIMSPRMARRQKRQHRGEGGPLPAPGEPGPKHNKPGKQHGDSPATGEHAVSKLDTSPGRTTAQQAPSGDQVPHQSPPSGEATYQSIPVPAPEDEDPLEMGQENSRGVPNPRGPTSPLSPGQQFYTPPVTPEKNEKTTMVPHGGARTDLLSSMDSGQKISDSSTSTTSSKKERRRFLRREDSSETTPAAPQVALKPGKKDKSSTRKSSLNAVTEQQGPYKDVNRPLREETPSSDDVTETSEESRRQRLAQIHGGTADRMASETNITTSSKLREVPYPFGDAYSSPHKSSGSHRVPSKTGSLPTGSVGWSQYHPPDGKSHLSLSHQKPESGVVMRQDKVVAKVLPQPQVLSHVMPPPPEKPVTKAPLHHQPALVHAGYSTGPQRSVYVDQTVAMTTSVPYMGAPHGHQTYPSYQSGRQGPQKTLEHIPGVTQPLPPWEQEHTKIQSQHQYSSHQKQGVPDRHLPARSQEKHIVHHGQSSQPPEKQIMNPGYHSSLSPERQQSGYHSLPPEKTLAYGHQRTAPPVEQQAFGHTFPGKAPPVPHVSQQQQQQPHHVHSQPHHHQHPDVPSQQTVSPHRPPEQRHPDIQQQKPHPTHPAALTAPHQTPASVSVLGHQRCDGNLQQHPPPSLQEQVMETAPVTTEPSPPLAEAGMGYTSDPACLTAKSSCSPPESHTLQLEKNEPEEEVYVIPDVSSASADELDIPVTPTATADSSPPVQAEPAYEPPLQTILSPELETAIHSLSLIGSPVLSDTPDLGPSQIPSPFAMPSAATPDHGHVAYSQINATMPACESSPVSPINLDESIDIRSPKTPTSPTSPKSPTSPGDFHKAARKLSVETVVLQPARVTPIEVSCTAPTPKISKVEVRSLTGRQSEKKCTGAKSSNSQSGALPKKIVSAKIQPLPVCTSANDKGERNAVSVSLNKDINAGMTDIKTTGAECKHELKIAATSIKTSDMGGLDKVKSNTSNKEPCNLRQSQLVMKVNSSGGDDKIDKTPIEKNKIHDSQADNINVKTVESRVDMKRDSNNDLVSKQNGVNVHRNESKLDVNSDAIKNKDMIGLNDTGESSSSRLCLSAEFIQKNISKIERLAIKKQNSPESAPGKVTNPRVSQVGTKSLSSRSGAYLTQSQSNPKQPIKTKSSTAKTGTAQKLSQSSLPKKMKEPKDEPPAVAMTMAGVQPKVHTSSVKILGPSRDSIEKSRSAAMTRDKVSKVDQEQNPPSAEQLRLESIPGTTQADISTLVQRSSGSEPRGSGREAAGVKLREDAQSRRTPERAQSFAEESQSPESEKTKVVMRAHSTRDNGGGGGVVMRRRAAPMKPEEELQKILNRRSSHLEEWEAQMASQNVTEADRAIEQYESLIEAQKQQKQKIVPPELIGSELFSVLRTKKIRDSLEDPEKDTTSSEEYVDAVQAPPQVLDGVIGKVAPVMTLEGLEDSATIPQSVTLHSTRQEEPKMSSILKKKSSVEEPPIRSILKRDSGEFDPAEVKPVSILKRDSMELEPLDIIPVSILKRDSVEFETQEIKPILRRGSKETDQMNLKPILRRGSQEASADKPASILKDNTDQRSGVMCTESSQSQPSLRKTKTVDITSMDPMFAKLVQQRHELESESTEVDRRGRSQTPPGNYHGEKRLSVAERISQMESKFDDYTPGTSGVTSPRVITVRSVNVSGSGTPHATPPGDTLSDAQKLITDDELLAQLNDMALMDVAAERRRRLKQRHGDDARYRTQPITALEVREADDLDSVMLFRTEIIKNTSLNIFRQQQKLGHKSIQKVKGQEIAPQPFHREKLKDRRKDGRFKTQPITIHELNTIKESGEPLEPITLHVKHPSKKREQRKRAEEMRLKMLEDSEDSDFDRLVEVNYRKLTEKKPYDTMEDMAKGEDVPEDDKSKMSLSQKMALFKKLEEGKPESAHKSSSRRFQKKRLERSKTQPVTEEELTKASDFAKNGGQVPPTVEAQGQVVEVPDCHYSDPEEPQGEDDALVKLSLADKMKIFSEKKEEKVPPKRTTPVMRRKSRKLQSRFRTQSYVPITVEEVEKAANSFSPLAMSLVKPPDPELLATMSLKDQREFMARWAEDTLTSISKKGDGKRRGSAEVNPVTELLERAMEGGSGDGGDGGDEEAADSVTPLDSPPKRNQTPPEQSRPRASSEPKPIRGILRDSTDVTMDARTNGDPGVMAIPTTPKTPELWDESFVERTSSVKKRDSSYDEDSDRSTPRIKNEAVERRRRKAEERKARERCNTQPSESAAPTSHQPKSYTAAGRHHTQPITEHEHQDINTTLATTPKGSIAHRTSDLSDEDLLCMLELKRSGEEEWKKRVSRGHDGETPTGPAAMEVVRLREKTGRGPAQRPSSIQDRLSLLQGAQEEWRSKVEKDKDVEKLTVEGKMKTAGILATPESPLIARRMKMRAPLTRESESSGSSAPTSPDKQLVDAKMALPSHMRDLRPRSYTDPPSYPDTVKHDTKSAPLPILGLSDSPSDGDGPKSPSKVFVPKPADENFKSFFGTKTVEEVNADKVEVTVDDFDHVFMESQNILQSVRKVKPQRSLRPTSKNPMKSLAARTDLQEEYTEIRTDIADREMKRLKRDQIAGKAGFAQDALAGLASKENFSKVSLRKTDSFSASTPGRYEPFHNTMLIHIKGRRYCQTRIVKPCNLSINSGDCFVLVTTEKVFVWIGEYSNVIEKSKAKEVATRVHQKRDLGCKTTHEPYIIEEQKQHNTHAGTAFWSILGGFENYQECGPQDEDELYEMYAIETNRVYQLDPSAERLVELKEFSGKIMTHSMLSSKQVFVFDFGAEFYVWTGKNVAFPNRKLALKLAKEIWDQGYDYTGMDINPMSPLLTEENGGLPFKNSKRPDWALFGKVNENMETVLFQGKFSDWPDSSQIIKVKVDNENEGKSEPAAELVAVDAEAMIPVCDKPVSLQLEGSHVGRGDKWEEVHEGLHREFQITTLSIKVWHVMEYDRHEVEKISYGQFHQGDTYVVRWHYRVSQSGMRDLKGQGSRHSFTGRERCAYFFWQGCQSSITEKGASALMTVELDEERGPQVRVEQGKEPPCFVRLFRGNMVIHIGRRELEESNTTGSWRMYMVRNELPREAYLLEVMCAMSSLRSRAAVLLVNNHTGRLLLWHGAKVATHTKQRCVDIALGFKKHMPQEMGMSPGATIKLHAFEEGQETAEFYEAIGSSDHSQYYSLHKVPKSYQFTGRLFHMTSVSGVFEANEIINPIRNAHLYQPFPFIQGDLFRVSQPALFLIDNDHEVFLWQGWWPEGTEEEENVNTGSAHARFDVDRRLALETTLAYCKAKNAKHPSPAFLVHAGAEPVQFTNVFPYWDVDPQVVEISQREGHVAGEMEPVDELLQRLTKTRYTWEELQERPLPEGVDPMKIEQYLEDSEFMRILEMTREEFALWPSWKQVNLKKDKGLF